MSAGLSHSRRGFMSGALVLGSGLLLSRANAAALLEQGERQLLLFDPTRPDACRWAAKLRRGEAPQPILGDRVRFARDLFSGAGVPRTIVGLSSYADFILLTGSAAEAGYRLLSEHLCSAAREPGRAALMRWVLARRR